LLVCDLRKRFEAVGGGDHLAAFALEQRFRSPADGLRIIDDHHPESCEFPPAVVFSVIAYPQAHGPISGGGRYESVSISHFPRPLQGRPMARGMAPS
jgi:hypothetical protein